MEPEPRTIVTSRTPAVSPGDAPLARRFHAMLRHAAVYGIGPVLGRATGLLLLPLYTNILSPAEYGTLELITIAATLLNVFLGLEVATAVLRFYHLHETEEQRRQTVSTAVIFTGSFTAIVVLLADVFRHRISILLFGTDAFAHLLRLAFVSLVSSNILEVALAFLRARRMSVVFTTLSVVQLAFALSLNVLFVAWWLWGVEGIFLSQLIVTTALGVGLTAWVLGRVRLHFALGEVRRLLAFGFPLIGTSLAWLVLNAADRAVLSGVGSLDDVGLYSLANRFGTALLVFIVSPFLVLWAAEQFDVAKHEAAKEIIARVFTYFFVCLCSFALAIGVWMDEVIRLMTAKQFWPAARIGPILVLAYVLWGVFNYFTTGILIEGKTKYLGLLTALAAPLHVVLCVGLGTAFFAAGVAWAKVLTLALLAAGAYAIAQRVYPVNFELWRIAKVVAVSLVLFGASKYMDGQPPLTGLALKAPLVLGFPIALACVGFLDAREKRWMAARARALVGKLQLVMGA